MTNPAIASIDKAIEQATASIEMQYRANKISHLSAEETQRLGFLKEAVSDSKQMVLNTLAELAPNKLPFVFDVVMHVYPEVQDERGNYEILADRNTSHKTPDCHENLERMCKSIYSPSYYPTIEFEGDKIFVTLENYAHEIVLSDDYSKFPNYVKLKEYVEATNKLGHELWLETMKNDEKNLLLSHFHASIEARANKFGSYFKGVHKIVAQTAPDISEIYDLFTSGSKKDAQKGLGNILDGYNNCSEDAKSARALIYDFMLKVEDKGARDKLIQEIREASKREAMRRMKNMANQGITMETIMQESEATLAEIRELMKTPAGGHTPEQKERLDYLKENDPLGCAIVEMEMEMENRLEQADNHFEHADEHLVETKPSAPAQKQTKRWH